MTLQGHQQVLVGACILRTSAQEDMPEHWDSVLWPKSSGRQRERTSVVFTGL